MTLPVRAGVRVTRFALRTGVTVSARALALASGAVKSVSGRGNDSAAEWPAPRATSAQTAAPEREPAEPERERVEPEREPAEPEPTDDPRSAAGPATPEPPPTATPPPPPPAPAEDEPAPVTEQPAHVSEEPALVEEFAEPGAEDGAGASVHVDEPWDGYAELKAREITARLSDASTAELAAVQLYESTHKRRGSVMSAVERELRIKSASKAPAADHLRKEQTNGN